MTALRLVEITKATLRDYLNLSVGPGQGHLVAPNVWTVAQSAYEPGAWLRGLAVGEMPVGLIAMIDLEAAGPKQPDDPDNAAYLWRLMIAAPQQGRGYGRQAIGLAFDQARAWGRTQLCVHAVEAPDSAAPLYRAMGLAPTDIVADGERLYVGPVPSA